MISKNWQDLIRPNKLEIQVGEDPKRTATVVAEPLERGFGLTMGNSLRRILLSSLQGAAVTSIHILAESHLVVHTWPEHELFVVDIFACSAADRIGHFLDAVGRRSGGRLLRVSRERLMP